MLDALHHAGHKYLKLLFVTALAGSSALFFIGTAVPQPPALVVVIIGGVLGVALEWTYFTVSCDLTEAVTEGNKGGIALNVIYTLAGGAASWFLFTNAALHVGWAPNDELLGLSREHWAMIMAGLIVLVIFALSARRKRNTAVADLQAIGRAVTIMLPQADDATRLRLLAAIAREASTSGSQTLPPARIVEEDAPAEAEREEQAPGEQQLLPAQHKPARLSSTAQARPKSGRLTRAWKVLTGGDGDSGEAHEEGPTNEQDDVAHQSTANLDPDSATPRSFAPAFPGDVAGKVAALAAAGYQIVSKEAVQSGKLRQSSEVLGDEPAIHQALESEMSDLETGGAAAMPPARHPATWSVPLPGVRGPLGTNHHNHHDGRGSFERWTPGSESADDPTFRR